MNSEGLAVAGPNVTSKSVQPRVIFPLPIRGVLGPCSTADEAIDLLRKPKHVGTSHFMPADGSGKLAIVEAAPQGVHAKLSDTWLTTSLKDELLLTKRGGAMSNMDFVGCLLSLKVELEFQTQYW